MMLALPIVVVFLALAWFLITRVMFRFSLQEIPGGREMIVGEIDELGSMSQGERSVLVVFASAAFFWIMPGLLAGIGGLGDRFPWLDSLDDTVIAIAAGVCRWRPW